jgi:hypothetical protein
MRTRSLSTFALTAGIAILAFGCGSNDGPLAPVAPTTPAPTAPVIAPDSASQSLLGGLFGHTQPGTTVNVLQRTTPLSAPITVSARIGILGGILAIPQTGLTVVVPPLAVFSTTTFSVTALAGSAVAYQFSPHGIHFLTPLIVTQSLANTQGSGLLDALQLGYFQSTDDITNGGLLANVTELLSVQLDLLHLTAISTIWHFSGYIYASGRAAASDF